MSEFTVGKRQRRLLWGISVPMALIALTCVYPVFFALNNALKSNREYILDRFGIVSEPTFQNFVQAWTRSNLSEYFFNSVVVTVLSVLALIIVSSLAGFALAVLRFPLRKLIFVVILASLMIPVQVVLVPFYKTIIGLGLLNTRAGLILSYTAFFLPFSVYLMTSFYSGLPRELVEAARIDGAKLTQVWWHVMLPMGMPALITLGILNTLYCWNDILISLLVLQDNRTLMVGIAALRGEYTTNVPLLTAGIVLAAAPIVILYLVFQRKIVSGIAVGAVKG
ncbi:carbohydrate ABC transporter permease [Salipiger sp. IMCC34102]|uniref:carbohydrate ABC transporter permease n=1 Tax=Salipiger sp. IMCC34102 TaxID=2510647 RepID=UPI00101D6A28|nr:carbohydrate ABC transporter permease [Salipiger sp. IMCC34102]RYH04273.1 carbohydrate ABC transporter permease [Salipiger sp. IMCC34102]